MGSWGGTLTIAKTSPRNGRGFFHDEFARRPQQLQNSILGKGVGEVSMMVETLPYIMTLCLFRRDPHRHFFSKVLLVM